MNDALDRLRRVAAGDRIDDVYKASPRPLLYDQAAAADELLRLTDPTLIDEVWIESIGFVGGCEEGYDFEHPYVLGDISIWNHNDPHDWCLSDLRDHIITTRGELRMLARLLKIDLKEQA